MKTLLISDVWLTQINGVAKTLANTRAELIAIGHEVMIIGPDRFRSVPYTRLWRDTTRATPAATA